MLIREGIVWIGCGWFEDWAVDWVIGIILGEGCDWGGGVGSGGVQRGSVVSGILLGTWVVSLWVLLRVFLFLQYGAYPLGV